MHTTVVKLKDGRTFAGPIRMWRPEENWLSIDDFDEGRRNATRISFDDIESAVTLGERISINKIGDQDELERARHDLAQGREHGWEKYPKEKFAWEG